MLQQPLAVIMVFALLAGALWLLRQQGLATFNLRAEMGGPRKRRKERRMRVVERLALTPQHSLHLVSIDGRTLLLSASAQGCRAIDQKMFADSASPDGDPTESSQPAPPESTTHQQHRSAAASEAGGAPPETAVPC